jgi:hypothetical protein
MAFPAVFHNTYQIPHRKPIPKGTRVTVCIRSSIEQQTYRFVLLAIYGLFWGGAERYEGMMYTDASK